MLPKSARVDKKTLALVFKNGKAVHSANLTAVFILTKEAYPPQVSFISPKTLSKRTTVRNLLRRRGYAAALKNMDTLPLGFKGAVIFGKKSTETFAGKKNTKKNQEDSPRRKLEEEIRIIFAKIKK